MTDAHERIWVEDERPLGGGVYVWNARNNPSEEAKQYAVEYVRADLVAVMEAENQRLREALHKIEAAPAWGYPDRWETTPAEVRQLARAALRSTEAP